MGDIQILDSGELIAISGDERGRVEITVVSVLNNFTKLSNNILWMHKARIEWLQMNLNQNDNYFAEEPNEASKHTLVEEKLANSLSFFVYSNGGVSVWKGWNSGRPQGGIQIGRGKIILWAGKNGSSDQIIWMDQIGAFVSDQEFLIPDSSIIFDKNNIRLLRHHLELRHRALQYLCKIQHNYSPYSTLPITSYFAQSIYKRDDCYSVELIKFVEELQRFSQMLSSIKKSNRYDTSEGLVELVTSRTLMDKILNEIVVQKNKTRATKMLGSNSVLGKPYIPQSESVDYEAFVKGELNLVISRLIDELMREGGSGTKRKKFSIKPKRGISLASRNSLKSKPSNERSPHSPESDTQNKLKEDSSLTFLNSILQQRALKNARAEFLYKLAHIGSQKYQFKLAKSQKEEYSLEKEFEWIQTTIDLAKEVSYEDYLQGKEMYVKKNWRMFKKDCLTNKEEDSHDLEDLTEFAGSKSPQLTVFGVDQSTQQKKYLKFDTDSHRLGPYLLNNGTNTSGNCTRLGSARSPDREINRSGFNFRKSNQKAISKSPNFQREPSHDLDIFRNHKFSQKNSKYKNFTHFNQTMASKFLESNKTNTSQKTFKKANFLNMTSNSGFKKQLEIQELENELSTKYLRGANSSRKPQIESGKIFFGTPSPRSKREVQGKQKFENIPFEHSLSKKLLFGPVISGSKKSEKDISEEIIKGPGHPRIHIKPYKAGQDKNSNWLLTDISSDKLPSKKAKQTDLSLLSRLDLKTNAGLNKTVQSGCSETDKSFRLIKSTRTSQKALKKCLNELKALPNHLNRTNTNWLNK